MQPLVIRDYQLECVAAIRQAFRHGAVTALVKLPTGSGKSITAGEFIKQLLAVKPDYRVLILMPKVTIVREFVSILPPHLTTVASHSYGTTDTSGQIVVATYQTLAKRTLPQFDLIVADEAHRVNDLNAKSSYYSVIKKVMSLNTDTRVLGLTATPFRDTGFIYGPGRFFTSLVFERDLLWTTDQGFTVPAKLFSARDESIDVTKLHIDSTGEYAQFSVREAVADPEKAARQVEDIIRRTRDRKKIAIACASIEHAELIGSIIAAHGEKVSIVHSEQSDDDKDVSLGEFETDSSYRFVTFVTMIAEGFNYPAIDCIVLLRPTRRANLYCQLVGRGLRPSPSTGKTDCLVLDYGHVIENCGPLNNPHVATRGGKRGLEDAKEEHDEKVSLCPGCGAFLFTPKSTTALKCAECGNTWEVEVRVVDKNLEEEPAIIDLYEKTEFEGVVANLSYRAVGYTQDMQRRIKKITVVTLDGQSVDFLVHNPDFVTIDQGLPYDKKKWLEGIERKYAQFINDVVGERRSMRDITPFIARPENEVRLKWTKKGQYNHYKSHTILTEPTLTDTRKSIDKKKDKAVIANHVEAIQKILQGTVLRKEPMDKQDKQFLKRGF